MDFNTYQRQALETAIYPNQGGNYIYPALGIANEVGELLGKIKKLERGDYGKIWHDEESYEKFLDLIRGEMGDVLWYLSVLAYEFDLELGAVAQSNLDKLAKRQAENKIKGDGDNR